MCVANSYTSNEYIPESNLLSICKNCVIDDVPVSSASEQADLLDSDGITYLSDEPSYKDVPICSSLIRDEHNQMCNLLEHYASVISETPGCTSTVVHDIELLTDKPVRSRVYPVPVHLKPYFEQEVEKLLELGIIRPSKYPYCFPCVIARKSDGYRLTVDFKHLNSITKFNAEPSCFVDEKLFKFSNAKYLSELDICKDYHQIKRN